MSSPDVRLALSAIVLASCGGVRGPADAPMNLDASDLVVSSDDGLPDIGTIDALADHATPDTTITDGSDATSASDTGADVRTDAATPSLTLAVIGDYGVCGAYTNGDATVYEVTCPDEQDVAAMVHGWAPDVVLTTGDDSYGSGRADQIPGDQAPYMDLITSLPFVPAFGNHDWGNGTLAPSLSYFALTRAYDVHTFGTLLSVFVLDTNPQEPDGDSATSAQADWLRAHIATSTSRWNVIVNHQAPYSSCGEYSYDGSGGRPDYRWIAVDGADLVLSGHSHVYERLAEPNASASATIPYVVIGTSGAPLQGNCGTRLPGQQTAVYGAFGALRMTVTDTTLSVEYRVVGDTVRDTLTLHR